MVSAPASSRPHRHSCLPQLVRQRAELFSIFLVIPAGFLRALASKQVQLDEDDDSDGDSEAGDGQAAEPPPPAEAQKVRTFDQAGGCLGGECT